MEIFYRNLSIFNQICREHGIDSEADEDGAVAYEDAKSDEAILAEWYRRIEVADRAEVAAQSIPVMPSTVTVTPYTYIRTSCHRPMKDMGWSERLEKAFRAYLKARGIDPIRCDRGDNTWLEFEFIDILMFSETHEFDTLRRRCPKRITLPAYLQQYGTPAQVLYALSLIKVVRACADLQFDFDVLKKRAKGLGFGIVGAETLTRLTEEYVDLAPYVEEWTEVF